MDPEARGISQKAKEFPDFFATFVSNCCRVGSAPCEGIYLASDLAGPGKGAGLRAPCRGGTSRPAIGRACAKVHGQLCLCWRSAACAWPPALTSTLELRKPLYRRTIPLRHPLSLPTSLISTAS